MKLKKYLTIDSTLSNKLRIAEKPGPLRTFAAVLAHSGDSWFWILGLAFVWWLGSPYWKSRALVLGIGVLFTAVFVIVVKFTVKRSRPEGEWGTIYRATDPHSFPSGHSTRAFMLAVITLGFGPQWFAIVLLIWAPLIALARVAMGVHYLSDIIAGFLLGIVIGGVMIAILKPLFFLS